MPLISVIVPIFNVELFLCRCIDSIFAQTFTDFELILVDDGSPDNCGKICDEYAKKDNRIHVIHKENGGLSDARNAGIDWIFANSDSEWITFIDSDDWIHPKYLERLFNAAIKNNVSISCGKYQNTFGENVFKNVDYDTFVLSPEVFFCNKNIYANLACVKLYRRKLFKRVRFPVGRICEDAFTTYKIYFTVDKIAFIDSVIYAYYQSENSIMRTPWNPQRFDQLDALEEQLDYFKSKYPKVFQNRKKDYFDFLLRLRNSIIPESEIENPEKYKKIVTKRLRRALWRYRAFPLNKYGDCYITVYPFLGKIRSIIKK